MKEQLDQPNGVYNAVNFFQFTYLWTRRSSMGFQKFFRAAALTLMAVSIISSGGFSARAQGSDPTKAPECQAGAKTINYWHGLTGPDGAFLLNMVNKFNAENKDGLCVNLTVINWDQFFSKWLSDVAA